MGIQNFYSTFHVSKTGHRPSHRGLSTNRGLLAVHLGSLSRHNGPDSRLAFSALTKSCLRTAYFYLDEFCPRNHGTGRG